MGVDVAVSIDPAQLARVTAALAGVKNGLKRATITALTRTARAVRAEAVKKLAAATGLKQTEIRQRHTRTWVDRAALRATVKITGRGIPLSKLKPRQNKSGVSFRTPEGRTTRLHAFIATMPTGHTGVFLRKRQTRLPIAEQYGPGVVDIISGQIPTLETNAAARLAHELDGQVDRLLQRAHA